MGKRNMMTRRRINGINGRLFCMLDEEAVPGGSFILQGDNDDITLDLLLKQIYGETKQSPPRSSKHKHCA